eukprot:gb/GECG01002696.1/.p1 GENE.gb/GECG01002696.1/~~gb/GECG01002696.1/.p1  ORF type:complete len:122 (+),score=6.14 gb/GECG01002696.1/:1-366(+)
MPIHRSKFFTVWALFVERIIFSIATALKVDVAVDKFLARWSKFVRWNAGSKVGANVENANRPKLPLEMFEYTGCPECSKVRECISYLGLNVIFFPCPPDSSQTESGLVRSSRFKDTVSQVG